MPFVEKPMKPEFWFVPSQEAALATTGAGTTVPHPTPPTKAQISNTSHRASVAFHARRGKRAFGAFLLRQFIAYFIHVLSGNCRIGFILQNLFILSFLAVLHFVRVIQRRAMPDQPGNARREIPDPFSYCENFAHIVVGTVRCAVRLLG
jgi:hypothetical protein